MTLLQKVIEMKIALGCRDDLDALCSIKDSIDKSGAFVVARRFGVLVNDSAEDFMMQFMSKYNDVVCYTY